jgi:alcohol dehydrogenase
MSSRKITAAVVPAVKQMEIREFDWPVIGPRDMLVEIQACGICGSDAHHFWEDAWHTRFPIIPGHEFIARVAEAGPESLAHHGVGVGDLVAAELVIPCWECYWCKRGLTNLCLQDTQEGREYGCNIPTTRWPGLWGGYATHLYVPYEAIVHRVPEHAPLLAAVFAEPLAVAVRAVNLASKRQLGDAAVIVGGGTIGLMQGVAAKAAGFDPVILLGTRDYRLNLARDIGVADVTVNVTREDPLKVVNGLTHGLGADVVFETAGSISAQQTCFDYARKAGTVVIVGLTGNKTIPINTDRDIASKELTVQASFLNAGSYEGAIKLIGSRRFALEKLVSRTFPLRDAFEAMRVAREEHDAGVKAVLLPAEG